MGLVGEASGIFSMPYSMSILQFDSVAIIPTSLITTFLNPFGALLGYRRSKQWNLDLALWLCVGAVLGSPIGPFVIILSITSLLSYVFTLPLLTGVSTKPDWTFVLLKEKYHLCVHARVGHEFERCSRGNKDLV
jgi:uncharacterized membrane protein YfcA